MNINVQDDLLPIKKSEIEIFNNVKANIIKMFVERKFINPENEKSKIDKIISDENDDKEYIIKIDNDENYNIKIPNKKIYVKFINEKVNSVNKSSPIFQFIEKHINEYKFIVVDDIQTKTKNSVENITKNDLIETYIFSNLKENKVDNVNVSKYQVLSEQEKIEFLNSYRFKPSDIALILTCDMMSKYYRLKGGQVIRTVRPSIATCESFYYRIVMKRNEFVIKT